MKKSKIFRFALIFLFFILADQVWAEFPFREYKEGEIFYYKMDALNDGRRYQAISRHKVEKTEDGKYFEKISWIYLKHDGSEIDLSPMKDFEQILSLDKSFEFVIPDITKIKTELRRFMAGPVFDLMTFYVDLNPRLYFEKLDSLESGTPTRFPYNRPSSWADGFFNVLGEDCLDFVVTLQRYGADNLCLRVEHVPPEANLNINLPEEWMKKPVVKGKENNWVQVTKSGKPDEYFVAFGYEYFDVHLFLDKENGMIKYAQMYNPVERLNLISRKIGINDNIVTSIEDCSPATPQHTFRNVSIELISH